MGAATEIPADRHNSDAEYVGEAVLNTRQMLELTQTELASVLALSPSQISKLVSGVRTLREGTSHWEFALLLLRASRDLYTMVGGDTRKAALWIRSDNRAFAMAPLQRMATAEGLVHVVRYLEAVRRS